MDKGPSTCNELVPVPKKRRLQSDVWRDCSLIYENGEYTGFAKCNICNGTLKHHKYSSGTTHLRNHIRNCKNTAQLQISSFFSSNKQVLEAAREKVCSAMVSFIALDMRPLSSVEGKGLRKFANTCIEIGAKHGKLSATEVLPSRVTVKRRLDEEAACCKRQLLDELKVAIESHGLIGVTTDMWSDLKDRNFICLKVHYVGENLDIKSNVATVRQYMNDKEAGLTIRLAIENISEQLDFTGEKAAENFVYVSDQYSNINHVLAPYKHVPCACHMIATVVKHLLQVENLSATVAPMSEDDEDMTYVKSIRTTINGVEDLAAYIKCCDLNEKLGASLVQSNATRWGSTLQMLISYMEVKDQIAPILSERNQEQLMDGIDENVVSLLISFLKDFNDSSVDLEGESKPTLHRVVLHKEKLLRRMAFDDEYEKGLTVFLKKRGKLCLVSEFKISDLHYLALFLNPKFKSMRAVPEQKQKVVEHAGLCLKKLSPKSESSVLSSSTNIDDEFLEFQDNEITRYLQENFVDYHGNQYQDAAGAFCALKFWSDSAICHRFPTLSRLAKGILSIPASSCSHIGQDCGDTLGKKRKRVSASTVESLMIVQSCGNN